MIPSRHRQTVRIVHDRLQDAHVDWAITGSLGLALHGIDVQVNDIDIQTDESGAYRIEQAYRLLGRTEKANRIKQWRIERC